MAVTEDEFWQALCHAGKATLLEFGHHPMMLLAEGTRGLRQYLIEDVPADSRERQALFYHLGASTPMNARRKQVGRLQWVGLVAECWGIHRPLAEYDYARDRPTDAPDRVEYLSCTMYDLTTERQRGQDYEILRTRRGHIKDLLQAAPATIVSNVLLAMFVAGWLGLPLEEASC